MKEKPEGIRTGDDWLVDQRCEEVQFRATKSGTDIRTLFCHSDIEQAFEAGFEVLGGFAQFETTQIS